MSAGVIAARRPRLPDSTWLRYAGVVALVLVVARLHVSRPPTLCILRATTGIPCPFCGGTTAAVDLGHGQVGAAFAASPIAPVMIALAPWTGRIASRFRLLQDVRVRRGLIVLVLAFAEIWQLHRFGLVGL